MCLAGTFNADEHIMVISLLLITTVNLHHNQERYTHMSCSQKERFLKYFLRNSPFLAEAPGMHVKSMQQ